ncbi:hypothetical protein GT037_007385 [Alternaria burnsii]|uniref:Uncharacterized protein n=1 Tax=Alternaria burnsii TaxID=1187904 RepID=A0A8H7B1K0_9PLEO|nr:uncharacterized protein GT037_007385 [Alternaria burnsii]KAF7674625.1 hypothetical protein GT037_007385 [Alternaria burnsii]
MSQISTPLSRTAVDPFSPSLNQDRQLSQADFEELFGIADSAQPVFLSNDSDIFEELGYTYEEDCIVPADSQNPSAISTPNFSDYDFGLNAPVYPTPGPNSPHPYPLELQRVRPATVDQQDYNHREGMVYTTGMEGVDSLVGGLLPTPIGTPLNELADVEELNYRTGTTIHTIHSEGPVFRHMRRPDEMSRSRRIIEIGALVVSNRSKLDPRLEPLSPTANRARILEKLGDVEQHLRNKEGKEALPACMTIRVALSRSMNAKDVDVADNAVGVCSEASGKECLETQCDTYNDHDDNEIMEMLMRENGVDGQDEVAPLIAAFAIVRFVAAEVAPEITTVAEGYNVIAKLPCIGCPFLHQDTSQGSDAPWTERRDDNALLLNISLPYDSAYLSINNAPLLADSKILPRMYVNQVLLDTSKDDVDKLVESNQLDNLGGAYFGASYSYSLRHLKESNALLFYFDVMEMWTDLTSPHLTVIMDKEEQKVLEVVLLQRPLLSAGDHASAYEIIRASLVPRKNIKNPMKMHMWFHDWDANGKKGTATHMVNSASSSFVDYISSGIWSLFIFILAVMALFVIVCLFIIFGCGLHKDDYEQAQHGKRKSGGRNDIESVRRFRTPEELGLRGSGRVVGVGKSD